MSKFIDRTGEKYNHLLVLGLEAITNGKPAWKCRCDCGKITVVRGSNLVSGAVKSCGCLRNTPYNKTHGDSNTKLYRHWKSMIYRCTKPNHPAYRWYGARGISVCDEWLDYENFKKWAIETQPDKSYTVDRIDVNGNYCPENCRWATREEQANNRRSNIMFEYRGERKNLMQWSKCLNVGYKLLYNRINKLGWDFEKAITTPVDVKKRNKETKNGRIHE